MRTRRTICLLLLLSANLALLQNMPLLTGIAGFFGVLLAPGLIAAPLLFKEESRTEQLALGLALGFVFSVAFFSAGALAPGVFPPWIWIVSGNLLSAVLLFGKEIHRAPETGSCLLFAAVLILAAVLRLLNLGHSEFQGDETRALFFGAGLAQGDSGLFFLHKKGPVEFVIPFGILSALGSIDEFSARFPFALAGIGVVAFIFILCRRAFSPAVAFTAGVFCSLEGFILAFARIVQYQSFLLLFAAASFYCAFRARTAQAPRPYLYSAAVFLALSLLSHYDAAIAAVGVLAFFVPGRFKSYLGPAMLVAGIVAAFYIPFFLSSSFSSTAAYLGQRVDISKLPANNLPRYFDVFSFYNSVYFTALVWMPVLAGALKMIFVWGSSLCGLPPGSARNFAQVERCLALWLTCGLVVMGFCIARPNTHFYVIHIPLLILSARALNNGLAGLTKGVVAPVAALMALLSLPYPWFCYIRSSPEFRPGYPQTLPAIYPSLGRRQAPGGAFFGFPHVSGWKAIGALYQQGDLTGSYSSNEEELITAWYTRGAERDDSDPDYYFVVTSASDPVKIPMSKIKREYSFIGRIYLDKRKLLDIFAKAAVNKPVPHQLDQLAPAFPTHSLPTKQQIRTTLFPWSFSLGPYQQKREWGGNFYK